MYPAFVFNPFDDIAYAFVGLYEVFEGKVTKTFGGRIAVDRLEDI